VGLILIYVSYTQILGTSKPEKVGPMFPGGFYAYAVFAALVAVSSLVIQFLLPEVDKKEKYEMESKYKLFLMFLPFAALCFVFSYLPLWGWRYAFFNYSAGGTLSSENFVGFKWFTTLFQSAATRADIVRVLRNTLAMSGLGILTSWVPMAFAIFLNEIKNTRFRRFVQTFTTIPNFISWVLVYAIALAIFSTDGFINSAGIAMGLITEGTNYLMGNSHIWLKMLLWGIWKGVGWSAIIYIAGISGIDQQLYEAATVDGAGRFQRMWHVTVPGLVPTYCVMLLMSIANILSNGMDQYLVFQNATNTSTIEVLDLYVYLIGIGDGNIPLSTVVGMVKSIVSVILLFVANRISKAIRGESIV
jgi:putative aldouronate transport system permease protein